MDIAQIITDLAGYGASVEQYRRAVKPTSKVLTAQMASLMGRLSRQQVPVLATVVDAIAGKLFVKRIGTDRATSTKLLNGWLAENGWELLERSLWEAAIRDGVAFLLVTFTNGRPQLTLRTAYNGAEGAAAIKGGATINVYNQDGVRCADIFWPDRIEKYLFDTRTETWVARRDTPEEPWPLPWVTAEGAPLGQALIPFGTGISELEGALGLQADLNEALLDLVAVSRGQGWPQRVISGEEGGDLMRNLFGQPVLDRNGAPVRKEVTLTPGSVLRLEGEKAKLDQLPAATVDRGAIDVILELLSLTTGVPMHRFTGQWPSGTALVNAEVRLNSKAEHLQSVMTPPLVASVGLMFALGALYGDGVVPPKSVSVEWYPPVTEDEDTKRARETQTVSLYNAGLMSLETAIRRLNPDWSDEEVTAEAERIREAGNSTTQ